MTEPLTPDSQLTCTNLKKRKVLHMKISENIHAIRITFTIPLPSGQKLPRTVYAYLVIGDQTALIDSGVAGSQQGIFDYLTSIGKDHTAIDQLIFTHAHPDHIGAAKAIRETSGCTTAAHGKARAWIEDVDLQFSQRPVPGFHTLVGGPVKIDRLLDDGDHIRLGNCSLRVLHTPGHSRDSISLFCPEQGVLITGDAIPHAGDLPIYEDLAASVDSINRLMQVKGVKVLLSSWCTPDLQAAPYRLLEEGKKHLQHIHELVRSVAKPDTAGDPLALCRLLVKQLNLPEAAVNPLLAKSFAAHLPMLDREIL
jgi:glyoxylase-like metal-dependent hydrolase (beta-lactamase superfamily II)